MPSKQEKDKQPQKKLVDTAPSWWQQITGNYPMSPDMEKGIAIARKENPNLAPVQQYGLFSKLMEPNALAYTSPGRTIYMNPATNVGQSPEDIADTLTHEQTHVQQMQQRNLGPIMEFFNTFKGGNTPYGQRPDEMEAFQSEIQRRARQGRSQTAVPMFTKPDFYVPRDIVLPPSSAVMNNAMRR